MTKKQIIACVAGLLILGIVAIGIRLVLAIGEVDSAELRKENAQYVGAAAGVPFSPAARLVHLEKNPWGIDAGCLAAIDIPDQDADALLAAVLAKPNIDAGISRSKPLPSWWGASPEPKVIERLWNHGGGWARVIIHRTTQGCTVYLEFDAG